MIIKTFFTKVMLHFINGIRRASARLVHVYNVGKVVFACNSHLATPAGSSIYGVLISSDTARQWL
ncbi:hypothetical protein [Sideroxydans sp. CL21]|uniref:hypothetical protein n=1 Tax=Sideroxydans sp. CL21 TaxID=2600596 RepID=UPI0012A87747|nr:hypothetical protein [Sideroxydans sp. CL21]VVC84457.1 hypothetical protein [Sideroxydans sp. CL21]